MKSSQAVIFIVFGWLVNTKNQKTKIMSLKNIKKKKVIWIKKNQKLISIKEPPTIKKMWKTNKYLKKSVDDSC